MSLLDFSQKLINDKIGQLIDDVDRNFPSVLLHDFYLKMQDAGMDMRASLFIEETANEIFDEIFLDFYRDKD